MADLNFRVPEPFRIGDEEFSWMQTERYYGRTDAELEAGRRSVELETFLEFLEGKLAHHPELALDLYRLLEERGLTEED